MYTYMSPIVSTHRYLSSAGQGKVPFLFRITKRPAEIGSRWSVNMKLIVPVDVKAMSVKTYP